ncbi:MAG: hypothetical protein GXY36_12075 [Chloroflexi bacterium]|nr:hypothetical protein [Chloroflexota bacterium]
MALNPDTTKSLDEQWLDFIAQTADYFERYPFMAQMRQSLFRTLIMKQEAVGTSQVLKNIAHSLLRRANTDLSAAGRTDVIVWLSDSRTVSTENLLPVYQALTERGISARVLVPRRVWDEMGSALPPGTLLFQAPRPATAQSRWKDAWIDFQAALGQPLSAAQQRVFINHCLSADGNESELLRVLQTLQTRIVLMASDHLMPNSSVCHAARQLGRHSIVIQHGVVQAFYTPLNADEMVIWGQTTQDELREFDVPVSRMRMLGSPRYDTLPWLGDPSARKAFQDKLGLPDRPTFVFFSNGNDPIRNSQEALDGCARWTAAAAERFGDRANILVRLHPNEDGSLYAGMDGLRVFKNETDLYLTLAGADAIGSLCSTALLEGLLYHKPILQYYADGWPELANNWREGLATRITSDTTLVTTLQELFATDPQAIDTRTREQAARVFSHQGHATAAVAEYIASCL